MIRREDMPGGRDYDAKVRGLDAEELDGWEECIETHPEPDPVERSLAAMRRRKELQRRRR